MNSFCLLFLGILACLASTSAFKYSTFVKVNKCLAVRHQQQTTGSGRGLLVLQSSNPDEQSTASEQNDEQPQEKDTDFTEKVDESIETEAKVEEAVVLSPLEEAILQKESELRSTLQSLENALKSERLRLGKVKDRKSESGKLGFFMVQAQVNDFLRRNEQDQKIKIDQNKREMVEKMLPVIDMFRSASIRAPASNEREESMHKNFGALLDNILLVIRKLGYEEYETDLGGKYDSHRHEIYKTVEGDVDNVVTHSVRKGLVNSEKEIIRREQVVISKVKKPDIVAEHPAETNGVEATDVEGTESIVDEE